MSQSIGIKIKEQRQKQKITQAELAKMVGVATITIRQYESGKREPRLKELQKIAAALGTSIDTLLGGLETFDTGADFEAAWKKAVETAGGEQITIIHTKNPKKTVCSLMDLLNDQGQTAAVDRIQELTEIPRYRHTALPGDEEQQKSVSTLDTQAEPPPGDDGQ